MAIATDKVSFIDKLSQEKTFTTTAELAEHGINKQDIAELIQEDLLLDYTPGIYSLMNANSTFSHTEVLAKYMVPEGILCFRDALIYWEITELMSQKVHFAVPEGTKVNFGELPVKIHYLPKDDYQQGIHYFECEGLTLGVYKVVKTVVDCFQYVWEVSEEHAFKAAYEAVTQGLCTPQEIRDEIARRNLESDYLPDLYSIIDQPDNIWKYV